MLRAYAVAVEGYKHTTVEDGRSRAGKSSFSLFKASVSVLYYCTTCIVWCVVAALSHLYFSCVSVLYLYPTVQRPRRNRT